jgi:6-phosphogluconate dehydrogenase
MARIWKGGCIIRARLLDRISAAFRRQGDLANLLLADGFRDEVASRQLALRSVLSLGIQAGVPMLATSAALGYYDLYRSARLPANLLQAQRDFFGAHTYQRVDMEGVFHTEWTRPEEQPA